MAGQGAALHHLRRTIAAELAIALIVLGLVAAWRFTPPRRALALAAARAHAHPHREGDG